MTNSTTIWQGDLPKIGIRPTIDGRLGGVRESLEDQTQALAQRVQPLLTENIRYPNGQPVECVVANPCIVGVAEAAATEELFRRENVGVSLTVTPCWCYGSETMDMDPLRPKAVWRFNGRMRKKQFDPQEFEFALAWVNKNCPEGKDCNAKEQVRSCTRGAMASTMTRINLVARLGPAIQIAEGYTVELPEKVNHVGVATTDSCLHAQYCGGSRFSSEYVERVWHREQGSSRLSCL